MSNDDKEKIQASGRELVIIPNNIFEKVKNMVDDSGKEIGTFETVIKEYNNNFKYQFVEERDLTASEREILAHKDFIFSIYGNTQYKDKILISTNINEMLTGDSLGVYDVALDCIILKRECLNNLATFSNILFHELVHATTKYVDNDRRFENELGMIIGKLSDHILTARAQQVTPEKPKKKNKFSFLHFK